MRNKVITKETLLEIASEIVKDKGVKSCSMRSIAKKGGIAVGTLYNYFPSHNELLESLFELSWNRTLSLLKDISKSEGDQIEQFREYVKTLKLEVDSRHGLGKKLYGNFQLSNKLTNRHKKLFSLIIESLGSILIKSDINKNLDSEELNLISRWVFMIIMDSYIISKKLNLEKLVSIIETRFI